ncbi:ATP-dependent helicase [bacterium]|nr:ATP-dependent helicase [bacterium]
MNYEEIVTNEVSPTLVLAGPGAGKTYLLSDRVKRLLDRNVESDKISVLTFGRDANQYMRNSLLDPKGDFSIPYDKLPHIATLNSLGMEIVSKKPRAVGLRKTELEVQDNESIKRLLFRDAAYINNQSENDSELSYDCKAKGECEIGSKNDNCNICKTYWEIMSACNYIDFDDQVIFANRILESDPDILSKYQSKATHLLVDEYQDINAAQFRMIKNISSNSQNGLFVVGDDAQSIYGFRGADPKFILNFKEYFNNAITPPLAHSRRCPKQILVPAEKMLKSIYQRWKGPFDLEFHVKDSDSPIVLQLPSEDKEAHLTARVARQAIGEKKTVLILAPKKDFFPLISKKLSYYGVPHSCPTNLLSSTVNKRLEVIQNLLRWFKSPSNFFLTRIAIEEFLNHGFAKVPGSAKDGKCSDSTIKKRIAVEKEVASLWSNVNREHNLFKVLCERNNLSDELERLRTLMIELLDLFKSNDSEENLEFISKFCRACGVWNNSQVFTRDIEQMLHALSPETPSGFGSVQMMTMRKAKGLEADVVVIVGLEDDIIPGNSRDVKEEARLFYVSMTRAKEKLYLFHVFKRPRNISFGQDILKKDRSRFLDKIGIESNYYREKADTA